MKKVLKIAVLAVFLAFWFCADYSFALDTEFHGRVQTNFVLRDPDGFEYGFFDDSEGVQWRNEIKFDITARPEYETQHRFWLDKIFLSYRGAYDAIFDVTDRYDGMREKSPADFELGRDDLEYENDLREAFVDFLLETENTSTTMRLGRQLVQWGEADGFNIINIVNPLDYSHNMFFENPDDLAIPLWMARFNYSMSRLGPFQNVGLEVLLVPDIRPTQMAPMDNAISTRSCAPYMFGFHQLKDAPLPYFGVLVDQTLGKLAALENLPPGVSLATLGSDVQSVNSLEAYGDTVKIIETYSNIDLQGSLMWDPPLDVHEDIAARTFDNMEYGVRLQAAYESFIANLYFYHGWQNDGAVDWSELARPRGTVWFKHPEQDMFGFSFNVYLPFINAVLRGEECLVSKMGWLDITGMNGGLNGILDGLLDDPGVQYILKEMNGWTDEDIDALRLPPSTTGWVSKKTWWHLIALDKDLWIRWLNPHDMIGTSWQFYWRHISGWSDDHLTAVFKQSDNYRLTGYFYTDYLHGQIHPELMLMYDTEGTWMTMASVKYSKDGRWYFKLSQMSFWGNGGWDRVRPGTGNWVDVNTSDFTAPYDLPSVSEVSFKVGYNW